MPLVCFARDRDDTADRGSFLCFHLKLLRLILHSDPAKFADEMKYFHGWRPTVVLDRDLSALQIGVHRFPPSIRVNVSARAVRPLAVSDIDVCRLVKSQARKKLCRGAGAWPTIPQKASTGVHELLSVGHKLARVFGARVHLLGQPLLTGRNGIRHGTSGVQIFR
jgi:hypothetical protein